MSVVVLCICRRRWWTIAVVEPVKRGQHGSSHTLTAAVLPPIMGTGPSWDTEQTLTYAGTTQLDDNLQLSNNSSGQQQHNSNNIFSLQQQQHHWLIDWLMSIESGDNFSTIQVTFTGPLIPLKRVHKNLLKELSFLPRRDQVSRNVVLTVFSEASLRVEWNIFLISSEVLWDEDCSGRSIRCVSNIIIRQLHPVPRHWGKHDQPASSVALTTSSLKYYEWNEQQHRDDHFIMWSILKSEKLISWNWVDRRVSVV